MKLRDWVCAGTVFAFELGIGIAFGDALYPLVGGLLILSIYAVANENENARNRRHMFFNFNVYVANRSEQEQDVENQPLVAHEPIALSV